MFSLAQPMVWDCLIVGLVLLGVFDCWVIYCLMVAMATKLFLFC
jgi:hypothetical protein